MRGIRRRVRYEERLEPMIYVIKRSCNADRKMEQTPSLRSLSGRSAVAGLFNAAECWMKRFIRVPNA